MIHLPTTGLSNNNTNIDCITNDRDIHSRNSSHEYEDNRKSYPQRNNRAKLNYRDLERGMYEDIRQSKLTFACSTFVKRNDKRYHVDEQEIIDLSVDDDDNDIHPPVWCICKKPWDHSRDMLRCYSCSWWYHGDCIGVLKEQARELKINGDRFICPSCRDTSNSLIKLTQSSDELLETKRKKSDDLSSEINHKRKLNEIKSKSISHHNLTKKQKTDINFPNNSLPKIKIHCIVDGCNNWAKADWAYCSSACIRRHINDRLQAIQQSKQIDNEDIPTRDDISLYDNKSKTILEKNFVPKIEDLCTWINKNPSYELVQPSLNQLINSTRSLSSINNRTKSIHSLNNSTIKQKINKKSNINNNNNNIVDIRSKVPTALYDKIILRLEKNNEKHLINENIRIIVKRIEEEMFRVYGETNNSYKNKFRSLLANISNTNNNFFYKQILSKELTAKQIVSMKSDDMLPPEEKVKRKDQFEKEVQMIINAEQQTTEEMARRARIKVTRQGLIDNDAILPMFKMKEKCSSEKNIELKSTISNSKEINSKYISTIKDDKFSSKLSNDHTSTCSIKKINSNEHSKVETAEKPNPTYSTVDLDNDYIEPESPTGIDALIYDDDDNNDDLNNVNISSCSSTIHSPTDDIECTIPNQQIIRDDYNPSKIQNETSSIHQPTSINRIKNQWNGVIQLPDMKLSCQSVQIYGECDYLINNIPEQLLILGRLRLADLWDYIRDSFSVRDILILTLNSNLKDNQLFLQYVDTMNKSGRASVISKCSDSSIIRDMYILAADTKECPSNILSLLHLPIKYQSKQLFLVIIGTGKKLSKTINQTNNNFIYKPISLQDSNIIRDPRLRKNKDPRLNEKNPTNNSLTLIQSFNDDLLKLISDSFERIRQSSTTDDRQSIIISTLEILKSNKRDDLISYFNDNLRLIINDWTIKHDNHSIPTLTIVTDDNLIEENMDVDDDQEDKTKNQQITNTVHSISTTMETNHQRKQRRKSRFSDSLPIDNDRQIKLKSNFSIEKINSKQEKSVDNNIDLSLNYKSPSVLNSSKSNILSTHRNESSPKLIENVFQHIPSYDYQNLSLINSNRSKRILPINSIDHSTNMLNLIMQQQKTKHRISSNTNQWKTINNNNSYYLTNYHDFDQPQE